MATIPEALALALQHQQAGRLSEAEALYRQILQAQPDHPDALHLLGMVAYQVGKYDIAFDLVSQAIRHNAHVPGYHSNLGEILRLLGKLPDAERHLREALTLAPSFVEARNNLGLVLSQQGKIGDAIAEYHKTLAIQPTYADAHNHLGVVFKNQGNPDAAIVHLQQAVALKPDYAEARSNLGVVLQEQGRLEEAIAQHREALVLKPGAANAYYNLGIALQCQGKLDEAVLMYRQALTLNPSSAQASNNLGVVLQGQGKSADAIAQYNRALTLKPDHAEAHSNLGRTLMEQGAIEDATACYRRALALKPDLVNAHSNLLFCLHYDTAHESTAIVTEYRAWYEQHARKFAAQIAPHANRRDAERPLRIGYVSADFKRHPVGYFLDPVLAAHDPAIVSVFCYSGVSVADEWTAHIRTHADHWREIAWKSDEDVARIIREDGIDILVDMSGHTGGNRLLVFARKPAPVQVTWIGFFTSTGLETMDYLLADGFYSPPLGGAVLTEQLASMPANHLCFRPPVYTPPVAPSTAAMRGYPTFGCFNNLSKINGDVVRVWAAILKRLPEARLILKTHALGDASVRERYGRMFQEQGIEPHRLDLLGPSSHAALLDSYGQFDIALDPFPYCGGWTTCEALWMGIPVITLQGASFSSCIGAGLLQTVGVGEWIADTPDRYIEIAAQLGGNIGGLATLREGLRARVAASSLCDADTFAHNLEQVYRVMWRKWCTDGASTVGHS